MIKSATIYRYTCPALNLDILQDAVSKAEFVECGVTQQKSSGFVAPREENGALVESIDGQYILNVMTEVRQVPAQALDRRVDEIASQYEQLSGRKPGRKMRKEMKEQALFELLPMAFTKRSSTLVWICPDLGLVIIDTASGTKAEEVVTGLIRCVDGLAMTMIMTEMSPAVAMAHWLGTGEAPYQFNINRECELKSTDEMKSIVKYGRHDLDIDEVRAHIVAGKVPTKLALTWRDRISLVLTEGMQLKKISFLDVVFEGNNAGNQRADEFDANVAIFTGEMSELLPDLFEALGGEQVMGCAA